MKYIWNEKTGSFDLTDIRNNEIELLSTCIFSAQMDALNTAMNFADDPERKERATKRAIAFQQLDEFFTNPKDGNEYRLEEDIGVDDETGTP